MGHSLKFILAVSLCLAAQVQADDDRFDAARRQMLAEIQETVVDTGPATGKARLAPEVMAALGTVPRHEFVPDALDAATSSCPMRSTPSLTPIGRFPSVMARRFPSPISSPS
jgi:hypothetical protein